MRLTYSMFALVGLCLVGPAGEALGQPAAQEHQVKGVALRREAKFLKRGHLTLFRISTKIHPLNSRQYYFPPQGRPIELTNSAPGVTAMLAIEYPEGLTAEEARALLPEVLTIWFGGDSGDLIDARPNEDGEDVLAAFKAAVAARVQGEARKVALAKMQAAEFKADGDNWSYTFCMWDRTDAIVLHTISGGLRPARVSRHLSEAILEPGRFKRE